jgi:hypothetical protein
MRSSPLYWSPIVLSVLIAAALPASAKLPALNDDAKAKAAEAAAKAAHGDKVAAFQLCKSMDKVAAKYYASAKTAGKDAKPPTETPACADPGPFAAAAPAAPPAAPVAAAAPAAKKP